jgi:glycosyltransferase involved in cell wall biosynthesis
MSLAQRTERVPVSVVIPCYRCVDTLERAVASVAAQTAAPQEVVLVEDHSADAGRTLASLRQAQERYRGHLTIRIIALERNSGPGEARNAAWEQAACPYIAFLDSDDSWHPRKLELQYAWMSHHPDVDFCGHATKQLGQGEVPESVAAAFSVKYIDKHALLFSNRFSTCSVMLKRQSPFRFPLGQRYSEDYQLWLSLAFHDATGAVMDVPLAYSYKEAFGMGGLTQNMAAMQHGELQNYRQLLDAGRISWVWYAAAVSVSYVKYWRRRALTWWRLRSKGACHGA